MSPEKKNKETAKFKEPSDISLQVDKTRGQIEALKKQQEELQQEKNELEDLRQKYTDMIEGKKEMMLSLSNGIAILEAEEKEAERMHELASETRQQFKDLLADISAIRGDILNEKDVNEQMGRGLILIERARSTQNKASGKIEALSRKVEADVHPLGIEGAAEGHSDTTFADAVKLGFGLAIPGLILAIVILVLAKILL